MLKYNKDSIILTDDTATEFIKQALHPSISPESNKHLEYVDKNINVLSSTPNTISAEIKYFSDSLVSDLIEKKRKYSDNTNSNFRFWDTISKSEYKFELMKKFISDSHFMETYLKNLPVDSLVCDSSKLTELFSQYISQNAILKPNKYTIEFIEYDISNEIKYNTNCVWHSLHPTYNGSTT